MHMSVYEQSDKLDSLSSPIVYLKKDFTSLIALKDISLVADDTDIVSMILMMVYIDGLLHAECRVVSGFSSTRAHLIFQRSTSSI